MKIKLIKLSNLGHFVLNRSSHRPTKQKIYSSICISSILLAFPSSKNLIKELNHCMDTNSSYIAFPISIF